MRRLTGLLLRGALPLLVLAGAGAVAMLMLRSTPEPARRPPAAALPLVEVQTLKAVTWPVRLASRGTVTPRTSGTLIPEVPGRIVHLADSLRTGGLFHAGDELLRIDPRNYENAVIIARSETAQARQALAEEQARVEQALQDWANLGLPGEPDALVRREPQLASARAALAAAEARLSQAQIDLERTRILAPYTGRVRSLQADVGQFVNSGSVLAEIFAVDYVEVRLPITSDQLAFLDFDVLGGQAHEPVPVRLTAAVGGRDYSWQARIVRSDGAVDTQTRQWFLIAQVDAPYRSDPQRPPLSVGQFVTAEIAGRRLEDVFVLPLQALRPDGRVMLLDAEDRIRLQTVELVHRDDEHLLVRGLASGDRLVVTVLPFASNGTRVQVHEQAGQPVAGAAGELSAPAAPAAGS